MLRIALVDDHQMVRQSFAHLINLQPNWQVSHEFEGYHDCLEALPLANTHVLLIDISLPEKNGIALLEQVRKHQPNLATLMVSMYEHHHYISSAIELGANGYLSKRGAAEEIITAIKAISQGQNYLSQALSKTLLFAHQKADAFNHLTEREMEIFALLARGFGTKDVAKQTNTMPKTVLSHRANIFQKLRISNQFELMKLALNEGMLDVSELV